MLRPWRAWILLTFATKHDMNTRKAVLQNSRFLVGREIEGLVGCMAGGIQSAREQWRTSSNETEALSGNNRAAFSHPLAQQGLDSRPAQKNYERMVAIETR